jgi:hypothetical protein
MALYLFPTYAWPYLAKAKLCPTIVLTATISRTHAFTDVLLGVLEEYRGSVDQRVRGGVYDISYDMTTHHTICRTIGTLLLAGANFTCLWFVSTVNGVGVTDSSASPGLRINIPRVQTEDKREFQGVTS